MADKVLVVEDDLDIATLIQVNLAELGLEITHCADGVQACEIALRDEFCLMLLDVMLPNMSGLDICRKVREKKPEQAIVMLTAKNSETDRVLGLELGADDYMTKPFSVRELQARVRSQIRKAHLIQQANQQQPSSPSNIIISGELRINQQTRQVTKNETSLDLTATEFELLYHLMQHPNQVFSRTQLLESVWGYQHSGYEHTVNSHINRLRAKVESDATDPKYVQTVWGVGYKFNNQQQQRAS
ncbi:response regulator transcription factor [Brumicola blandensis]|uniref:Phosphate regulon transcriptional regulatory protein PhoB n=1 Tax=Brumicola blandensis TaxID=3075611 RepID=A0AAW8R142_9ALTE|nr:response regulator transcription factor [Alteromonas sp. W409]MDT0582991.1 response regulator transcription factor [Alteromonas sp. W409]